MNAILALAAVIAVMIGVAFYLIVQQFSAWASPAPNLVETDEPPIRHPRRLESLLSPVDVEFARSHGLSTQRLWQLRTERRKIYRAYLRDLVSEFNGICRTLQVLIVNSAINRPDLTSELARQRFTFYRALAATQIRLALHAYGWDQSPSHDMMQALDALHASLQQLVQMSPAC